MKYEQGLATYDYHFASDASVVEEDLLDITRESLELTNQSYTADRSAYFEETYSTVHKGGPVPYAHYHRAGDSASDVVLVINPFGTRIDPGHEASAMTEYVEGRSPTVKVNPNDANKLIQGKFLYDTMRHADIHDNKGDNIPLIVVSSPSLDHRSSLSRQERKQIAKSDFTPLARRALDIVRNQGYNRIHAAGYSLGTIASKAVELAGREGVDVLSGSYVGDAPHFKRRHPAKILPLGILPPYMLDSLGMGYENNWAKANGLLPRKEGADRGESYSLANWYGNGNAPANLAIGKGLSYDGFSGSLKYMNTHDVPMSLSWSESKLMKGFEHYINNQPDALELSVKGLL